MAEETFYEEKGIIVFFCLYFSIKNQGEIFPLYTINA